jgi:hypothetical protein
LAGGFARGAESVEKFGSKIGNLVGKPYVAKVEVRYPAEDREAMSLAFDIDKELSLAKFNANVGAIPPPESPFIGRPVTDSVGGECCWSNHSCE